ncbi:DUF6218 family protein [Couchioplanes caeruleus]|uniref:DUF6218 family protein n=1 Tax=Couchioplanes caeruleus TaxID=56438 RepID=UPI0020BF08BF|nr:DUF6218 family protein [Couchioplanes caeruleus]UQU62664.1 DUF6218 family protein [Couchioplanes caeruleus]
MTSAEESIVDESGIVADYLPGVRGHGVLAAGFGVDDKDSLAVWKLGPTGGLSGAWVFSQEDLARDTTRFHAVMHMLAGRCLVGWTRQAPVDVLSKVAHLLPTKLVDEFAAGVASIADLLDEVCEHRERYGAALEAYRATAKSKLAPLAWAQDVPADREAAERLISFQPSCAASPVVASALSIVGSFRRAVELWQDTEQVRYRRSYLRSLGEPQPLPPRWLAHLRATAPGLARIGE